MKHAAGWLLALGLWPALVFAGHGLLNSFSDLEWLPPAGRTPDQWNYRLDTWREEYQATVAKAEAAALEAADVPCGPINTLDQVYADPQVVARGAVAMRRGFRVGG